MLTQQKADGGLNTGVAGAAGLDVGTKTWSLQTTAFPRLRTEWAPASRPKKGEPGSPFSTNEALAKAANVSDRTIKDAKAAHKAGLTDMVKEGALTVKEAAQVARGTEPKQPKRTLHQPEQARNASFLPRLRARDGGRKS